MVGSRQLVCCQAVDQRAEQCAKQCDANGKEAGAKPYEKQPGAQIVGKFKHKRNVKLKLEFGRDGRAWSSASSQANFFQPVIQVFLSCPIAVSLRPHNGSKGHFTDGVQKEGD